MGGALVGVSAGVGEGVLAAAVGVDAADAEGGTGVGVAAASVQPSIELTRIATNTARDTDEW